MKTEENTMRDELVVADSNSPAGGGQPEVQTKAHLDERLVLALRAAGDKKALDSVVLDLRPVASFTDYFVITSGTNARQVQAIADAVTERLKQVGERSARIEGYAGAEWVLLDYGDFVVHIFEVRARAFFDLERLWRDAQRVPLTAELLGEAVADDR